MLRSVLLAALLVPQMAHAACETILAIDSTKVAKTGDTMTGPLVLSGAGSYISGGSSITTSGSFFGPLVGNASTCSALLTSPTTAGSGYVSRGIDTSGNVQAAWVETAATSGSTNPITSGAAYTALTGKAASGANGDITALTGLSNGGLKDGTVYGQDIAASTVTLNKLNQSGCTDTQVPAWSDSAARFVCTTPASAGVSGSGTNGRFPIWTGSSSIGNSSFVTGVSSGIAISTHVTLGVASDTVTLTMNGTGRIFLQMISKDGATQNAGCLVVIEDDGTQLVFSSTNTASKLGTLGVLQTDGCVPNTACYVQTYGRAVIQETGATTLGDEVITSTTRCQGSQAAPPTNSPNMKILKAIGGAGYVPVFVH